MSSFAPPPAGGGSGGLTVAQILAALYPAPHIIAAAGATQSLSFDAGARETTWDVTMAANTVFSIDMTNATAGAAIVLYLRQDATAGRAATLPSAASPNGYTPALNVAGGQYDQVILEANPAGTGLVLKVGGLGLSSPAVPAAPTLGAPIAGNGQLSFTFTDGSANGSAITSRKVRLKSSGAYGAYTAVTPVGGVVTITGLTNGTAYTLQAVTTNGVGDSLGSAEVTGTPTASLVTNYVHKSSNLADTTAWPVKGTRGTGAGKADPFGGTNAFEIYVADGQSGLEQAITGLMPSAPYIMSFYAATNGSSGGVQITVYADATNNVTTTPTWQRFSCIKTADGTGSITFNLEGGTWDALIFGPQLEVDNANHTPTAYNATS